MEEPRKYEIEAINTKKTLAPGFGMYVLSTKPLVHAKREHETEYLYRDNRSACRRLLDKRTGKEPFELFMRSDRDESNPLKVELQQIVVISEPPGRKVSDIGLETTTRTVKLLEGKDKLVVGETDRMFESFLYA